MPSTKINLLFSKTLNAGQICLSPDYIFVKKDEERNLISELQKAYSKFFPEPNSHNQTSMVNKHHLKRMNSYLLDATKKGATVESLGKNDDLNRNMISTKIDEINDNLNQGPKEIHSNQIPPPHIQKQMMMRRQEEMKKMHGQMQGHMPGQMQGHTPDRFQCPLSSTHPQVEEFFL